MRPHECLPIQRPSEHDPGPVYFYENIVKPLTKDFCRIMTNGLTIDQNAVEELRETVTNVLSEVENTLSQNSTIKDFQAYMYPKKFAEYKAEIEKSMRDIDYYIKPYKHESIPHRTYVVNHRLESIGASDTIRNKWTVSDLKKANEYLGDIFLDKVLNKSITQEEARPGMLKLAFDKLEIWNKPRYSKIDSATPESLLPKFNPGSNLQLRNLFEFLEVEPIAFSKTSGEASWNRASVEEVFYRTEDGPVKEVLQAIIDYSFSNIISTNFVAGFDKFIINGKLHGNLKLLGAKSARPTSNSVNLLNMPSTGSIYAKPLKKCFTAPEGYLIASSDFGQLEDRVIANLTEDTGKCNIFLKDLDSHCYNALGYSREDIAKHIDLVNDMVIDTKAFKKEVSQGNKDLKAIRQNSKPKTFKLSYGGFPDSDKGGAITQEIFDRYHNELYPGITKTKEEVLSQAKLDGYVHLGLGWRIYSDDIEKDSRTLWNACSQFWSILTLIAINEIHYRIDAMGYSNDVIVTSTIYDSIYFIVKKDPTIVKWLNDNLIPIMTKDFMENQIIKNTAELCVGTTWADVEDIELPNNCSLEHIRDLPLFK